MEIFVYRTHFFCELSIFLFIQITININGMRDDTGKIVGGLPTDVLEFPFAVRFFNKDRLCSGTILNSWTVMTAAHCLTNNNVNDMTLGVGSNHLQDYNASMSYAVSRFVIHEDYNKAMPFAADIALLFVYGPIGFSKEVQKGILANSMEWKTGNEDIEVIGWGLTQQSNLLSMSDLMRTTLKYVPCEKYYNLKFTEDMFCLYGNGKRDTCQGDSGGGVVWRRQIIGIVSHGYGCAVKEKPGVYTNVLYYRKWIEKKIREFIKKYCRMKGKNEKSESFLKYTIGNFHSKH